MIGQPFFLASCSVAVCSGWGEQQGSPVARLLTREMNISAHRISYLRPSLLIPVYSAELHCDRFFYSDLETFHTITIIIIILKKRSFVRKVIHLNYAACTHLPAEMVAFSDTLHESRTCTAIADRPLSVRSSRD